MVAPRRFAVASVLGLGVLLLSTAHVATGDQSGPLLLLRDINTGPDPDAWSNPRAFIRFGALTLFIADDGVHGCEPWRTDGTEAGTAMLADVAPGTQGSCIDGYLFPAVVIGQQVLFVAGADHRSIWKTDGTNEGTSMITDLGYSADYFGVPSFGGLVYSRYDIDSASTGGIWISDGTPGGARRITEGQLVAVGEAAGAIFFIISTYPENHLWRSDGTAEGTRLVAGTPPTGRELVAFRDRIFFSGADDRGQELWSLDPLTDQSEIVRDILPGSGGSSPAEFRVVGEKLFFFARGAVGGTNLWVSDGSGDGTRLIGPMTGSGGEDVLYPSGLVPGHDAVYFFAAGTFEVWKSDGTPEGTVRLHRIEREPYEQGFYGAVPVGDALFFNAATPGLGAELWHSDGTPGGAALLSDVRPGVGGSVAYGDMIDAGGFLLFSANDGNHGAELWRSDGTAEGTRLVKDINTGRPHASPDSLTPFGDDLLFSAYDPEHGRELWISDGTQDGTRVVADIYPGRGNALDLEVNYGRLTRTIATQVGNAFFAADSPGSGVGLWTSDGTTAGTRRVHEIVPGPQSGLIDMLRALPGEAFFSTIGDSGFGRLWSSDGTEPGTREIAPPLDVTAIAAIGDEAFLSVSSPPRGLWRQRPDDPSPVLLAEINQQPENLMAAGQTLYFSVNPDGYNYQEPAEIWRSDGTPAGTSEVGYVSAHCPIAPQVYLSEFTALGDRLFFVAGGPEWGSELLTTDGNLASGVRLVADIFPGNADDECRTGFGSFPHELTVANGVLFFAATDAEHGTELWRSDGSTTVLVKDIRPGLEGSDPEALVEARGILLFSADDGEHGRELWRSDGTPEGTELVEDLAPAAASSEPRQVTRAGDQVYLVADDGLSGREVWHMPLGALPSPPATPTAVDTPLPTPTTTLTATVPNTSAPTSSPTPTRTPTSKKENDRPCTVGADCASGFCSYGDCCNTQCDGANQRCDLDPFVGTCLTVTYDLPDGSPCQHDLQCLSRICQGNMCKVSDATPVFTLTRTPSTRIPTPTRTATPARQPTLILARGSGCSLGDGSDGAGNSLALLLLLPAWWLLSSRAVAPSRLRASEPVDSLVR